jgi:outer membrane lipoprotein carrier protein
MRRLLLTVVCLFALVVPAMGQDLATDIQKQYDSLQGFTADFMQQLKNAASGEVETRTGRIAFKQPGLIRWETETPEKELLLVGQDAVWDYFPEEKTALKYQVSSVLSSKSLLRFISGKANLKEDFVIESQGTEEDLLKLKLIPKEPEPSLVLAYIWVDPTDSLLRSILILDFYGNANKLGLDNLALNPKLDAAQFVFTLPAGVEVKDNTADAGAKPDRY